MGNQKQSDLYILWDLNNQVDKFIEGYGVKLVEDHLAAEIRNFSDPKRLRNYIETKAVYSEMHWPIIFSSPESKLVTKVDADFSWSVFSKKFSKDFNELDMNEYEIDEQILRRVIERGGNRFGARRGYLFSKEFGLDSNLPVSYGIDFSDPDLRGFLGEVREELDMTYPCPVNYFSRTSNEMKEVEIMTFSQIFSRLSI